MNMRTCDAMDKLGFALVPDHSVSVFHSAIWPDQTSISGEWEHELLKEASGFAVLRFRVEKIVGKCFSGVSHFDLLEGLAWLERVMGCNPWRVRHFYQGAGHK